MADGSQPLLSRGRIGIVEDHPEMALLLSYNLQCRGFEVDVMNRGDQAETLLGKRTYDLLILDWMLPGLSGVELLRRLRRIASTQSLPVIMLTARKSDDDVARALEVGADEYFSKPFSIVDLMACIDALIARGARRDATSKLP